MQPTNGTRWWSETTVHKVLLEGRDFLAREWLPTGWMGAALAPVGEKALVIELAAGEV